MKDTLSEIRPAHDIRNKVLFEALEETSNLIGLKEFKTFVIELVSFIDFQEKRKQNGFKVEKGSYHTMFLGNAGVGKTTAAKILAKILYGLGIVNTSNVVEVSRVDLVSDIVGQTAIRTKEAINKAMHGVLFIDEAYALARGGNQDFGKEAIDTLVKEMEDKKDEFIVILAGYTEEMEAFLKTNGGLPSRISNTITFQDYNANELLKIAEDMIAAKEYTLEKDLSKKLKSLLESKQIKGKKDIGNARLVRNLIESALRKHALNYRKDPHLEINVLTAADFSIIDNSFSLEEELNLIVGQNKIKDFVRSLESQVYIEKQREKFNLMKNKQSLHMVFSGNPGTGKTTFARIIAKMLKEMGILKKGHLVEVDRSQLVGQYMGHTAVKTKNIIESAVGGVLFIDEAYSLSQDNDNFGKEAIDTLVKYMEDYHEDLVVIVAGYDEEMQTFLTANQGLSSRFNIQLTFNDYSIMELGRIAFKMFMKKEYKLTSDACRLLQPIIVKGIKIGGNGRFVRNAVEQCIRFQSIRLRNEDVLSKDLLQTITADDMIQVLNSLVCRNNTVD